MGVEASNFNRHASSQQGKSTYMLARIAMGMFEWNESIADCISSPACHISGAISSACQMIEETR
jgi:hypothetical protein